MGHPWGVRWVPMRCPWDVRGAAVERSWDSRELSVGCPSVVVGFP